MAEEGITDPLQAVKIGARERVIPILMTALAAGLGAYPDCPRPRRTGQRNSGAHGISHSLRPDVIHHPEHARGARCMAAGASPIEAISPKRQFG